MTLASHWASAAAAIALLGASTVSNAAIVVYTDRDAFLGAVFASGTDSFDELVAGPDGGVDLGNSLIRNAGAYSYRASAPSGVYSAGTAVDAWLSINDATESLTFDAFAPGIIGIGGFFFGSDIFGQFGTADIILTVTDGSGATPFTVTNPGTASFRGFVSETSTLTSLTVTASQPDPSSRFLWPTVNDLTLGEAAPPTTVPEPATLSLLALGLGLIGLRRRSGLTR